MPPTFQAFRDAVTSAQSSAALDLSKPGLRVLMVVGALAVAVAVFFVLRSQPTPEPLPPAPVMTSPTPSPTMKVTVQVAGKVRSPGVYLLPQGSRVTDAVSAAGGLRHGASTGALNLARRLLDGEQIVVGAPAAAAAPPGLPGSDPATAVLDLNSATTDQLEELPGVGEVLAARIAEFRTAHGGFTSVDQLREVSGIGAKKYEEIKPKVRV
ncbi:ComEA family DNA-binding protein [Nonomuraea sp. NPDC049607]|uniref:ComEA family DNA-binding protein n=1 Tax=Nonomuraea sp. NPDC049607 TaxID=3154732 RepID=UPI00342AFDDF